MSIDILQSVRTEIQDLLGPDVGTIVVAGGAVRDAVMGRPYKDIDVFILSRGSNATGWNELAIPIRQQLLDRFQYIKPVVDWHRSEPYLVTSIRHPHGEVQIMLRNLLTVDQLLDTFDWNVSLFALTDSGPIMRQDPAEIKPGGMLWTQTVTHPKSTLRRGFRFSERFHMRFRAGVIESICARIAKRAQLQALASVPKQGSA